jgi:hypothetical protein
MGLSTKDLVTSGGGGFPKTISPGNVTLKINKLELEDFSFIEGAKHLLLHVETEPIEGFEGFYIDKDNESLGRHAGQVGKVKASMYAFADGVTKGGIKIERDRSLMIFLKSLCNNLGISSWFDSQDDLHATIDDFVIAFNKSAPFKDIYLNFCVAGREYIDKNGYTNYNLYLPKADKGKYAYGSVKDGKVLTFDESVHLKKQEVQEVKNFGDDDDLTIPNKTSTDFSLD